MGIEKEGDVGWRRLFQVDEASGKLYPRRHARRLRSGGLGAYLAYLVTGMIP
jgi:hypothetical protein